MGARAARVLSCIVFATLATKCALDRTGVGREPDASGSDPDAAMETLDAGSDAGGMPPEDAGRTDGGASCGAGDSRCGSMCVNLDWDTSHCGRCFADCTRGDFCRMGHCEDTMH